MKPDRVIVIPSVLAVCALVLLPVVAAIRTTPKVPSFVLKDTNAEPTLAKPQVDLRPPPVPLPTVDQVVDQTVELDPPQQRKLVRKMRIKMIWLGKSWMYIPEYYYVEE